MKNDPREIKAKFDSVCSETGIAIKQGGACIYYPLSRKVFSLDSKSGKEAIALQFDDVMGL